MRMLRPLVRTTDTRTVKLPPKRLEPVYNTPQFAAWRAEVTRRAGRRCEAIDKGGLRCNKGWPEHRIYADHIVELRDGGNPFDLRNGQCLCASHHTLKTVRTRVVRYTR